ncbi:MAG: hypothetical protein NLN65_05300 [Candidatus Poseidoniaceae archaeon]|nr:hypothetical protein [Candidatus Poseidoniaceae archaeon]
MVDDTWPYKVQLKRILEMPRNYSTPSIPELEERLNTFKSYKRIQKNGQVDKDHLYWLDDDLALYALQTDHNLRAVFLDSYVEMENEIDKFGNQEYLAKIFSMEEFDFRGKAHMMLWVGLVVGEPENKDSVDIIGFHGTTVSCAFQMSKHPTTAIFRGPRHVDFHKLTLEECYLGTWNKPLIYVAMQRFGCNGSSTADLTVITVIAVETDEQRVAIRGKTKAGIKRTDVLIGRNTLPKVLLFCPDDETMTSRKCDRNMSDYQHDNVKEQLAARWKEVNRKTPPPWGLKQRESDAELKQNSEDMRKFAEQPEVPSEKFSTHIGMNILTEEDKRERRRARFAEEEPFEDDVDHRDKDNIPKLGWPKQFGVVSKPYFYHAAWYQEWSENDLVAYRIPERSQDEIDDYRSRRTRHILDIMNPELLRALRESSVAVN